MKIILILFIGAISFFLATNYIRQCNYHQKAVNQCLSMIENIEVLLTYNSLSVQEIFKTLSQNDSYSLLTFIKSIHKNMECDNNKYILNSCNLQYINSNLYLKKDDKDNLINFFSLFGKSDLNGQIMNCKKYKEIFKKKLDYLDENEKRDSKSISVLIVGVGMLLIILLF